MLDISSDSPLYKQLSKILLKKITDGEWKYNEKIPTEVELCSQYGISRMTVRQAIDDLKNKGYIAKKQGLGTFVTHPKMGQEILSFRFYDNDLGETKQVKKVIGFKVEEADLKIAERLALKEGDNVIKIERIFYNDDIPTVASTTYIPYRECPGLTEQKVQKEGLYNSMGSYGKRPDKANRVFEAVILKGAVKEMLGTPKNTAGFHIERISWSNDTRIEFTDSYMRGDMIQFSSKIQNP